MKYQVSLRENKFRHSRKSHEFPRKFYLVRSKSDQSMKTPYDNIVAIFYPDGVLEGFFPNKQITKQNNEIGYSQGFCHTFYENGRLKKTILSGFKKNQRKDYLEKVIVEYNENGSITNQYIQKDLDVKKIKNQYDESLEIARSMADEVTKYVNRNSCDMKYDSKFLINIEGKRSP